MSYTKVRWPVLLYGLSLSLSASSLPDTTPDSTEPLPVLRVLVLPCEKEGADANFDNVRYGLTALLRVRLSAAPAVSLPSWKGMRHVVESTGWTIESGTTPEQAANLIDRLSADMLVVPSVRRESEHLIARVVVYRRNGPAETVEAVADSWTTLLDLCVERITRYYHRPFGDHGCLQWSTHGPQSEEGLLALMRAFHLEESRASNEDHEVALRDLLALEPHNAMGLVDLLMLLLDKKQQLPEALALTDQLLEHYPTWCLSQYMQTALSLEQSREAGRDPSTVRPAGNHPGCPALAILRFLTALQTERWEGVQAELELSYAAHPEMQDIAVLLALRRSAEGDVEGARQALAELGDAWKSREFNGLLTMALLEAAFDTGNFYLAVEVLLSLSDQVNDEPKIAEFLTTLGPEASQITWREDMPNVPRPEQYTPESLETELQQRLTPAEITSLVRPLEISPAIRDKATQLTRGLTNEFLRAFVLFGDVSSRGRGDGDGGSRTADQALTASALEETRLSCQEHAKLLVTMARAVGLEAYLVHVERTAEGTPGYHDCVAMFLGGRGCLLDPTWGVFGIAHQEFVVLDDLQAIAHQAMQGAEVEGVTRLGAGLKLHPDSLWTRIGYVRGMIAAHQCDVARRELERLQAEGHQRWDIFVAAAELDNHEGRHRSALTQLQKALALSPCSPVVHMRLAETYVELDDLTQAAEHAEKALQFDRGHLDRADRMLWGEHVSFMRAGAKARSDQPGSREDLKIRAHAGEWQAQMALAVVLAEENQHDQALSWLLPAAESGYPEAQRNCAMLLLAVRGKEAATEAVDWLRRAACQGSSEAQFQLGQILYSGKLGLKDEVEGCFWAILATQGGHADARYLLKEMEWALSASQLAEAQTRADRFQPQRENKNAR